MVSRPTGLNLVVVSSDRAQLDLRDVFAVSLSLFVSLGANSETLKKAASKELQTAADPPTY